MAVDLLALAEEDGFKTVRHSTSRGGQYNGTCPWCCGHDRFRIQPNTGQYGFFACSQCGRKGSAVDYLIGKRGLSKMDALLEVGWKPKDGSEPRFILPAYALDERASWDEPPAQWQGAALDFALQSQKTLWGDQGRVALDYLRSRAFSDETIKKAMLGYHPAESWGPAREWGRNIKLWAGIVIPWLETGQGAIKVWRITVRSLAATDENRYKLVSSGSNGLYLVDSLKLKRYVVVMTEGEFDALSVAQECGDLVAVVATGTTEGSHTPRWVAALATQPKVAVAFDAEKDKGDAAADWWLQRLSNAQRLRPYWKDANQMLQDGVSLRDWTRPTVVSQIGRAHV